MSDHNTRNTVDIQTDRLVEEFRSSVEAFATEQAKKKPENLVVKQIKNLLLGDSSQFCGKSFVTPEVKQASEVTKVLVTGSSWFHFIFFVPILGYTLRGLGAASFGVGGLAGLILLALSNTSGVAAARRTKGNKFWSDMSLLGYLALSVMQTSVTGVGSELIINAEGIKEQYATQVIVEQKEILRKTPVDSSVYSSMEKECSKLKSDLKKSPNDADYVRAWGTYLERNRNWREQYHKQKSISGIPTCVASEILKEQANSFSQQLKAKFDRQVNSGSAVNFLKKEFPDVYIAKFNEEGEIRQGNEAVAVAWNAFFGQFFRSDLSNIGQLGFSFLMFLISVITSSLACLVIIAHANRKDVQLSHSPEVKKAVIDHLLWLNSLAYQRSRPTSIASSSTPSGGNPNESTNQIEGNYSASNSNPSFEANSNTNNVPPSPDATQEGTHFSQAI